ncbi:acyltransferase family protein [Zavarzinia sp. CC-PAN008]|uniref:acyltransferase family protein n=1 Tax=Zavarzinia sp. CC-PAN008 TaxID=3243332 RepID=UPI003F7460C0
MTTPVPDFRPDVEGLRGVAVALVVVYHFWMMALPGGYIAVDVFFVISGFVVTRLLARQLAAGRFSLWDFYESRARRLVPAISVMSIVVALAGTLILLPRDLEGLGAVVASLSVFASNLYLDRVTEYFTDVGSFLIHTWSISVEVQFYLVYPLVMLAIRKRPLAWLVVGTLASFAISAWWSVAYPGAAYFQAPSRAWAFGLGGILAMLPPGPARARWIQEGAGLAGLGLIVLASLTYDHAVTYPGFAALVPCLAAALVIWSGQASATLGRRLLSLGPVRFLGRISYSLYLWHLPIWFLWRYWSPWPLDAPTSLAVVAVCLAVATLSWRLVEEPFRRRRALPGRRALAPSAVAVLAAQGALGLALMLSGGWPQRLPPAAREVAAFATSRFAGTPECGNSGADYDRRARTNSYCRLGDTTRPATWALWGDSHAIALAPALSQALAERGHGLLFGTLPGCPPALDLDTTGIRWGLCPRHNAQVLAQVLATPSIRHVVLVGYYAHYFGATSFQPPDEADPRRAVRLRVPGGPVLDDAAGAAVLAAGLQKAVAALTAAGKVVHLYDPVPTGGHNIPRRAALALWQQGRVEAPAMTLEHYRSYNRAVLAVLDGITARPPGRLVRIRPVEAMCRGETCATLDGAVPLYRDNNHVSVPGSRLPVSLLLPYIDGTPPDGPD